MLASNNPFADLLSSSDATPDSAASDDIARDISGPAVANNPFLAAVPNEQDDIDFEDVGNAAVAVDNDPWSSHNTTGIFLWILILDSRKLQQKTKWIECYCLE